jgi:hypothetical protein
MAVKSTKIKEIKVESKPEVEAQAINAKTESRWNSLGWVLLLFAGMSHMLPEQLAPILKWSLFGVSLQMAVGVVSVVLALNFLLED